MRASSYQQLIDALEGINAPPEAKRQFEDLLRRNAKQDGVTGLERRERVKFARKLLDQREERTTICARLMSAYDIKESTAYRDIEKALQVVPNSRDFWDWNAV